MNSHSLKIAHFRFVASSAFDMFLCYSSEVKEFTFKFRKV